MSWKYLSDRALLETDILLKKTKENRNKIINTSDLNIVMNILVDDAYEFNSFYTMCGLMSIVYPDKKIRDNWSLCDIKLSKYVESSLKKDTKFYEKIVLLRKTHRLNLDEQIFLDKILDSYYKCGYDGKNKEKVKKLRHFENQLESSIANKLLESNSFIINRNDITDQETMSATNISFNEISEIEIEIENNKYYYPYLAKKLNSRVSRKTLDTSYMAKSKYVLEDFLKLVLCRYEINKNCKKNTINLPEIKNNQELLKKIISNLSNEQGKLFAEIYDNNDHNKINHADVLHYISQMKDNACKTKFTVQNVITAIFDIIKKYFMIEFKISKNKMGWDDNVLIAEVFKNNKLIGCLYLDLLYRDGKTYQPLSITLNTRWEYPRGKNQLKLPCLVLIASYESMTNNLLTYDDVITLMKEFGQIVHHFSHESSLGINNTSNEYDLFMIKLFENIAIFDEEFIKKIINNTNDIQKLFKAYKYEKLYTANNTCIDALFEILIYTSDVFVKFAKDMIKKQLKTESSLEKVYHEIYNQFMDKYDGYFDYKNRSVSPNLLFEITNNKNCNTLMWNIINDIISFNIVKNKLYSQLITYILQPSTEKTTELFANLTKKLVNINSTIDYIQSLSISVDNKIEQNKLNKTSLIPEDTNYYEEEY
jgi:hypothetical protein